MILKLKWNDTDIEMELMDRFMEKEEYLTEINTSPKEVLRKTAKYEVDVKIVFVTN